MAFIKVQKLQRDSSGHIISGSASIVNTIYGNYGSYHAKHVVSERLGKVISLSDDKKSGIFLSPTRGVVEYDARTDTFTEVERGDPRLSSTEIFPETEIHTVFGDVYLLLKVLEKHGLLKILRDVFPKDSDYERVICHILHGVLKDGSRVTCDDFIAKSFASYLCPDVPISVLHTDSRFFSMLGDDAVKISFFKAFVSHMRGSNPEFGRGCYVDSTPLPNDISDNPFNALCCHGISASEVMTRLILVLDEETGLPVWYDIIPGNVVDMNTILTVVNDVADSLDIEIDSLVLDAGYVSKELVEAIHIGTEKTVIGRMPARKGYPFKTLYWHCKDQIGTGKYDFVRKGHAYFGKREEIKLFGHDEYAYIYVDHYNALKRFTEFLANNEEEFQQLKERDKAWQTVKGGYFVLLSNVDTTPSRLLEMYFGRTDIETVFKTSKEYLDLLPLSKWTDLTVRGKILHDILDTIVLLLLRKLLHDSTVSTTTVFGRSQALMCFRNSKGIVTVETPGKQVKTYYKALQLDVPSHVNVNEFMSDVMEIKV